MDLCHCINPVIEKHGSNFICINCHMYYEENSWKSDPRVNQTKLDARKFTAKQQSLIDLIMNNAEKIDDPIS